jgi:tyrosyl-tRNA synthetase
MHLKQELEVRWFLKQYTDEKVFSLYDEWWKTFYVWFDPTADSLHLGNFVQFMFAINFMKRGNKLILIAGGATGMIGDPWGKDSERTFLSKEQLASNVANIETQMHAMLKNLTEQSWISFDVEVINNATFYEWMSYLGFLRDVGKHMTINQMMTRETVKKRIEDPDKSISYTEFSYMLLQWYDFVHLYRNYGCALQIAWSDQRGNLVTGIELIRKLEDWEGYGVTCNLITDSTGRKFGKSEGNAIWLNAEKNSPYVCYNYFMNCGDEDIEKYLLLFTLLSPETIKEIWVEHSKANYLRTWQARLAYEITKIIYGETASQQCETIKELLYSNKNPSEQFDSLDKKILEETYRAVGGTWASQGKRLLEVLVDSWLVESNAEAKKAIKANAISLNGEKISDIWYELQLKDYINGYGLLKKGKKTFKMIKLATS